MMVRAMMRKAFFIPSPLSNTFSVVHSQLFKNFVGIVRVLKSQLQAKGGSYRDTRPHLCGQ